MQSRPRFWPACRIHSRSPRHEGRSYDHTATRVSADSLAAAASGDPQMEEAPCCFPSDTFRKNIYPVNSMSSSLRRDSPTLPHAILKSGRAPLSSRGCLMESAAQRSMLGVWASKTRPPTVIYPFYGEAHATACYRMLQHVTARDSMSQHATARNAMLHKGALIMATAAQTNANRENAKKAPDPAPPKVKPSPAATAWSMA